MSKPNKSDFASPIDAPYKLEDLVIVTVTFHPDLDVLRAQMDQLPYGSLKVIVDNASEPNARSALRDLSESMANVCLVENIENIGLAAALNQGVQRGRELRPEAPWCLLLDQDSEPHSDCVQALFDGLQLLMRRGEQVGCVGPLLIDAKTGLSHGFHQMTSWYWRRVYPPIGSEAPVSCTNLNGSGTLMSIDLFLQLEGLDESLFIDHVDTEWSFRLLARGYTLWGVPNAIFKHRMGEGSLRYWLFGWRVWPSRSPARHRYLFRNALWLMRRPYVPRVWKCWAGVKLALTAVLHILFDHRRGSQLRSMVQGLRNGVAEHLHD